MKSPEVYATLREGLGPQLKSMGFKREKAFLSWSRPHDGHHTVLWFQVSRDGWDDYAGSKFVVEFQRSERPEAGSPSSSRTRLVRLLTDEQRAEASRLQMQVIANLRQPPAAHPMLHVSPDVTRWYLDKFEPLAGVYGPAEDLWLRYAGQEHVQMWSEFLRRVLPGCVEATESMVG